MQTCYADWKEPEILIPFRLAELFMVVFLLKLAYLACMLLWYAFEVGANECLTNILGWVEAEMLVLRLLNIPRQFEFKLYFS